MGAAACLAAMGQSKPPIPPWPPSRRDWKGVFIIPDLFPSAGWPHDIFGGDGHRLWTPAYGCYDDAGLRREMRREFRAVRGYRFWPYDCAGWIYHSEYGYLSDDPARVRRDLLELLTDDIIPVVSACNDADGGSVVPFDSFTANADLIPIAFPMWEMNGPLGVAERQPDGTYTGRIIDAIRNTRAAMHQDADLYLHFTSGHGAPGYPEERDSWRFVRDEFGVAGLMSQDEGYMRDPRTGDPEGTGAGLQDTAERLATLGLLNVRFEQCTYAVYNNTQPQWTGWHEAHQMSYGDELGRRAPSTAGFGDGGTASN